MLLINLALRLLRIAGEVIFCFEVNRFLGRAVKGPIRHRLRSLQKAETKLLKHVRTKTITTTVILPSGLHIHTIIAGEAAKVFPNNTTGKTLVLFHGHSMAAAFWFRNIDMFLDMGYTSLYIPDLPGWGRSSRPTFKGDVDDAVDFFLTPLKQWADAMGLTTFSLCGHSLGAYIAHEYTLRYPQSVTKLVLASPAAITRHTRFSMALWFSLTPQRFLTRGGLLAHIIFTAKYPSHRAYNMDGFRDFILYSNSISHRSGDAAAARLLRFWKAGNISWQSECVRPLLETVSKVSCPVQLITGDRDDLVHVGAVHVLYRAMLGAGNDVRMQVIADADHSPHIYSPTKFAKALLRGCSNVSSYNSALDVGYVNKTMASALVIA